MTTLPAMRYIAALLVVALAACGGSSSSSAPPSEAFCRDLRTGLTPFQIYSGVKDEYSPEKFADLAYGFAAVSCPDELKTNAGLRSFLEAWDINPDT